MAPNSTVLPVCFLAGNLMVKMQSNGQNQNHRSLPVCLCMCVVSSHICMHVLVCVCVLSVRWFTTPMDNKIKIWGNTMVPCLSHSVTSDIPSPQTLPVSNFDPWNFSSVSYTIVLCPPWALERLEWDKHYVHVCMTGFPDDQLHQLFVIETWRTNLKKKP